MIERSFIQVDGMPRAGKTALVEHILRAYDGFASVARCVQDDRLREPRE